MIDANERSSGVQMSVDILCLMQMLEVNQNKSQICQHNVIETIVPLQKTSAQLAHK